MRRKKVKISKRRIFLPLIIVTAAILLSVASGLIRIDIDAASISKELPKNYVVYNGISDDKISNDKSILFFVSSWCGSCGKISTSLKTLAVKYPAMNFYEINIEESRDIANKYSISQTPSVVSLITGKASDATEITPTDIDKFVSKYSN